MSSGYDGSILFDTSLSPKGFNAGIKRISESMKGVMSAVSKGFGKVTQFINKVGAATSGAMAKALAAISKVVGAVGAVVGVVLGVVAAIALIAMALVGAGIAIFLWAQKFTNTLLKSLSVTSAYRGQVLQLKGAFDTLKGSMMSLGTTILTAIAPAIMTVINWLVKAINYASMFIAALSGQKTVMQYVSGSADSAASSTGAAAKNTDKLANSTDKAKKAAKGALAAFDQINVLQQETAEIAFPDTPLGGIGGGGGGGNMQMVEVPIDPSILEKVDKIKGWFKKAWEDISGWAIRTWNDITFYLNIAWAWIEVYIIKPIVAGFVAAWEWVKQAAIDAWTWISGVWAKVSIWFKTNVIDPLVNFFTPIFAWLGIVAYDAWLVIKTVWGVVAGWFNTNVIEPVKRFFAAVWEWIKTKAGDAWAKISEIWMAVSSWFAEHVTEPLKYSFMIALDWVKEKFETIFTGIKDFVKGIINGLIDLLNGMLRGAVNGLNNLIGVANSAGGSLPGWKPIPSVTAPQIPRLAKGGVVPAHSNMLAMIGEGSKREIVAPEDLLRRIAREENENSGMGDFTVVMPVYLDSEKIFEGQKRVSRRRGTSLIVGG
jgi:hypothetical protein